ncbi:von Willebrand factor A domain-containing protein 7 [Hyalella azteca]|uniref:von Willebrand factor A domain-containing protein 7 n=1 Tax=Hyalella azteca TaxID=294128 RepID=A0A8B7NH00_HYAAZ|nr:von Willebrand factor A domain-containing protein 7 [Hyalella azteca]
MLVKLVLLAAMVVGGAWGFLGRGGLLEGYGDVLGVVCPQFDPRTPAWDHVAITTEGATRALVELFQEESASYVHRRGMTLTEAYQAYSGDQACPRRLLLALQDITDAATATHEGDMGATPMYNFNNEQFLAAQAVLEARWGRLVGAVQARDMAAARLLLGTSLAALQDFYAHSNWVELGRSSILEDLGLPGGKLPEVARPEDEACVSCPQEKTSAGCTTRLADSLLTAGLLTSDYVAATGLTPLTGKCVLPPRQDGGDARVAGGIGKDLPSACFSPRPDLHDRAAQLAAQATTHYLTVLRHAVGNDLFSQLMATTPRPALAIVADGRADYTQVVLNILQSGQWTRQNNKEPEEYILVTYSETLRGGGVLRSTSRGALVEALKTAALDPSPALRDPLSALHMAAHAAPPDAEVFMLTSDASLGATTTGGATPLHTQELLLRKRIKVTPLMVGQIAQRVPRAAVALGSLQLNGSAEHEASLIIWGGNNSSHVPQPFDVDKEKLQMLSASRVYQVLATLSLVTGSHIIDVPYETLKEVSTNSDYNRYYGNSYTELTLTTVVLALFNQGVLLHRDIAVSTSKTISIPLDNSISGCNIALYGAFVSATMTADGGSAVGLLTQRAPAIPSMSKTDVDRTFKYVSVPKGSKKLTLTYRPVDVASVIVTAAATTDLIPAFYRADVDSIYPSLQPLPQPPSAGMDQFLGVTVTAVDTSSQRHVVSVDLAPLRSPDSAHALLLPTMSPRLNTYVRLDDSSALPRSPFSVIYRAQDSDGRELV